jgi:hypothetical protein
MGIIWDDFVLNNTVPIWWTLSYYEEITSISGRGVSKPWSCGKIQHAVKESSAVLVVTCFQTESLPRPKKISQNHQERACHWIQSWHCRSHQHGPTCQSLEETLAPVFKADANKALWPGYGANIWYEVVELSLVSHTLCIRWIHTYFGVLKKIGIPPSHPSH